MLSPNLRFTEGNVVGQLPMEGVRRGFGSCSLFAWSRLKRFGANPRIATMITLVIGVGNSVARTRKSTFAGFGKDALAGARAHGCES